MSDTLTQADPTQVAAGQMFPEDYANDFAVTAFLIRQALAEMETCTPVQVIAVHPGQGSPPVAGTVDVQLLVSLLDGNGNAQKQGIVYGIPYMRMQGGKWAIVIDPAVNDFGFIVSASRDISNVVKNPGQVNPGSFRVFSFSDGIYIGGAFSNTVPAATFWLKPDGTFQMTDSNGTVLQSIAGAPGLNLTGDLQVTGKVTAGFGGTDSVGLQTHFHTASGGNTTPPLHGT